MHLLCLSLKKNTQKNKTPAPKLFWFSRDIRKMYLQCIPLHVFSLSLLIQIQRIVQDSPLDVYQ